MAGLNETHITLLRVLFVLGITIGSQNIDMNQDWLANIARYIVYFILVRVSRPAAVMAYDALHNNAVLDFSRLVEKQRNTIVLFVVSSLVLYYSKLKLFGEDFVSLFVAYLLLHRDENNRKPSTVTYGVGMACSYFEGYLNHVIPSDGYRFVGFQSLPRITKDVAGVKNREYKNSAYMIRRPDGPPVYLAVECATPIHTLYNVVKNRQLYSEIDNIDKKEVIDDFTRTLTNVIDKSEDCRGKCELVYFDTDSDKCLAEVLLDKIRAIEPNFENISRERD
ncbi:stimulator of interferon genes protein isoform X6 [Bombyx mori]|uniref:stimulator of interferon genes protein isoform X6 n=1 Tax=Bombyx mori TaxID=7091 RepID=UPI00034F89AE